MLCKVGASTVLQAAPLLPPLGAVGSLPHPQMLPVQSQATPQPSPPTAGVPPPLASSIQEGRRWKVCRKRECVFCPQGLWNQGLDSQAQLLTQPGPLAVVP